MQRIASRYYVFTVAPYYHDDRTHLSLDKYSDPILLIHDIRISSGKRRRFTRMKKIKAPSL
jgi:hypothetical protein